MKRSLIVSMIALLALASIGCRKPYDVPEFHEIGSSHTAFLVPLEGNTKKQKSFESEKFLESHLVATKRVQIPHRWVQTGRMWTTGHYVDTLRLITVNREPVTREWSADPNTGTSKTNQAIWFESRDSVGASTGISCTARIKDDKAAAKFLYNYPAAKSKQSATGQDDGQNSSQLTNAGDGLASVMDKEIRAQIQGRISDFATYYPMDSLREHKREMMNYVRHGELPEDIRPQGWKKEPGVIEFFDSRGIEITTLGQFGGFTYENKKIQDAIDGVFEAQQDEEVAKAETLAQTERNKAIKLAATGKAEAAREKAAGDADAAKTRAEGESEAIKLVADAKAYEITKAQENWQQYVALKTLEIELKRLDVWDGKYPQSYIGPDLGGLGGQFLIQTPKAK